MRKLYEQCLSQTQFSVLNFEQIFRLSQKRLKRELKAELIASGYTVQKQKGFLYAAGTLPVLLVAHLDTVHYDPPETICYSADGAVMMSPQGIGGDDRAGVYMILRLIQDLHCHVLFCEAEETGGHGARAFTKSGIKPDVNYIVELDRMGSNDAVFYQCRNRQFERHINSLRPHGTYSRCGSLLRRWLCRCVSGGVSKRIQDHRNGRSHAPVGAGARGRIICRPPCKQVSICLQGGHTSDIIIKIVKEAER